MVYPIGKLIITPIYKLWLRKAEGIENVPKKGAFIIAANHTSYYDAMLLHSIIIPKINRKIRALVNSYYWKPLISRWFLEWGECIPVYVGHEKDAKAKNEAAFQEAVSYLKKGGIIQIFPEGARSHNGKLQKAYTGIARLALTSKVPVLPAGIIGSEKVMPKGALFPRFARCDVKIGKSITFEKYYGKKPNNRIFEEVTRSIMKQIAKLTKQQYNY